jgi:hypothetical protein
MNKREIPLPIYDQSAASEFLGERFFLQPTYPSQLLGQLLHEGSVSRADIDAHFAEVMEARGEELSTVNVGQNVRHARNRVRRSLGNEALVASDDTFELDWRRMPRLDPEFYGNVVKRAVQRHGFDINTDAALQYAEHLAEEFGINGPLEMTMLRVLVRLQGIPYHFNARDREVGVARREAIQAVRRRLDTYNEAHELPPQTLHPLGAKGNSYFARPHLVDPMPERVKPHLIEHTHNEKYGEGVLPHFQLMGIKKRTREEDPLGPVRRLLDAFTSVPEPVSP